MLRAGFSVVMLALSVAPAQGSPQATVDERRVATATGSNPFSGEIDYAFDTALNKTSARFQTSLAPKSFFARVFSARDVDSLIAVYEFGGRAHRDPPDAVRLSLVSNEFRRGSRDDISPPGVAPILTITYGDVIVHFPLGIAQRIEELPAPDVASHVVHASRDAYPGVGVNALTSQVHIQRTATARIPICDFMALVNQKSVHGTVAGLRFDLNEGVISGLREFAAQMAPTAADQTRISCGNK